jgi:hypothetical protein
MIHKSNHMDNACWQTHDIHVYAPTRTYGENGILNEYHISDINYFKILLL